VAGVEEVAMPRSRSRSRSRACPGLVAAALAAALALLAAPATGAATAPEVDAAVQVTANPAAVRGHAIPSLAVHPHNRDVLALAEVDAYANTCTVHVSTNGGLGWQDASRPAVPSGWPGCQFAATGVAADVAFGPDGALFYAFSGFNPATYESRIFLARSDDLGQTWDPTVSLPRIERNVARNELGMDALPSLAVDPGDPNRVYLAWWSNNGSWNLSADVLGGEKKWCDNIIPRSYVATSTDGGRNFGPAVDLAPGIKGCMTEPYLTVGRRGELLAFFGQEAKGEKGHAPPAHLFFSVSRDGGRSFEARAVHDQASPNDGTAADSDSDWLSAPSPGVDRRNGNIYVTWEEMGTGTPKIMFMRSTDDGRTWSSPRKLNTVDPQRDWDFTAEFPALSVAPDGRIDVAWYDWRDDVTFKAGDEENGLQNVYYTYSTDGGTTWAKELRVSDRSIDRRFGARKVGYITGPPGLASTDDTALLAWDDTRNGNDTNGTQDVYFTRARFAPPATALAATGKTGTRPVVWALLGAAVTLLLGGLVFGAVNSAARTRDDGAGRPGPREEERQLQGV
jgi:hypothetical protein